MQHFDGIIEKFIRDAVIDFETGMAFSTNAGNLRLELADFLEGANRGAAKSRPSLQETEIEIER